MSQFIPCEVSWTDNSSGDRDELGSEVTRDGRVHGSIH